MCISAAAMMAISAGVSVLGQLQAGQAQKQAADANALENDIAAAQSREAAKQEADRIRKAGDRQAGAARAAFAGSGIVVDQGSAVNINQDIYQGAESDALNTLLTGERQASAYNRKASMYRAEGENAVTSSLLSSAATAGQAMAGWKGAQAAGGNAFADRAGAIGTGSGGRMRTITGGR